jgi:glycosyltransferase involved in cell wall biosynthesis
MYQFDLSKSESLSNINSPTLKVLFVSSGNLKNFDVAPFIKVQGESLRGLNIEVDYFKVSGKGLRGYLSNVRVLRQYIKENNYDLVHAHFTLSAWVVVLGRPKIPVVLSLMGTDAYGRVETLKQRTPNINSFTILTLLIQPFVRFIISKSPNIEKYVWIKRKSHLLPNGVDFQKFFPTDVDFREELGLDRDKKYVLFLGNTKDPRKNFALLESTKEILRKEGIEIIAPYPIPHETVVKYLNSVDLVVMCSLEEGSPNVVKEAMACNCKGVFTDVGDVKYLVEGTKGYRIAAFETVDIAKKIIDVSRTNECEGRKRLADLGLELNQVAKELNRIYQLSLK